MFVFAMTIYGESTFIECNVKETAKYFEFIDNNYLWVGSRISKSDFVDNVAKRSDGFFVYFASTDKELLKEKVKEYLEGEVERHKNMVALISKKLEKMSSKTNALYDEESDVFICDNCGEELSKEDVEVFSKCPACKCMIASVINDQSML